MTTSSSTAFWVAARMSTGIVHHAPEVRGGDGGVEPDGLGCGIQAQPRHPDDGREAGATQQVLHRLAGGRNPRSGMPRAQRPHPAPVAREQVQGEEGGDDAERDADELVGQVRATGDPGDRGVQGRGLLTQGDLAGEAPDDPQDGPDRRRPERDAQDEPGLGEEPARPGAWLTVVTGSL